MKKKNVKIFRDFFYYFFHMPLRRKKIVKFFRDFINTFFHMPHEKKNKKRDFQIFENFRDSEKILRFSDF